MLTVFAYDPALCIKVLRQGLPERAGILPPGELIPRSTYLHAPNAPHDTHWRPTADLHSLAFCDVVKDLLARRAPVPALWHFPGGAPSILLFTGDEDVAPQEANQKEFAEVESCGGAMSLYVVPGDNTSMTREEAQEYSRRGHEISVHPDLTPTCGKSKAEQLAKAEADVLQLRSDLGVPVETVRNHCVMWPGYLDLPELWERLGIGLDTNCLTGPLHQSPEAGPYGNGSAGLPLRFVREDGTLIDVLQQHTHHSDDLFSHPTIGTSYKFSPQQFDCVVRRMLEDAARWFHVPHCPIIHPGNYVVFSEEAGKSYLRCAKELGMPIWNLARWQNFWRAREAWRMAEYSQCDGRVAFTLSGPPCEGLFVTLPSTYDARGLSTFSLNDTETKFENVARFGKNIVQAALPEGAQEVRVVAEYS